MLGAIVLFVLLCISAAHLGFLTHNVHKDTPCDQYIGYSQAGLSCIILAALAQLVWSWRQWYDNSSSTGATLDSWELGTGLKGTWFIVGAWAVCLASMGVMMEPEWACDMNTFRSYSQNVIAFTLAAALSLRASDYNTSDNNRIRRSSWIMFMLIAIRLNDLFNAPGRTGATGVLLTDTNCTGQ